jgi:hypothetical protein
MKRANVLAVFVFLLGSATGAMARLGDNVAESDKFHNHGKPGTLSVEDRKKALLVGPGSSNTSYIANGMLVRVGFKNGETFVMQYKHTGASKLTPAELQSVLKENEGNGWQPFTPTAAQRQDPAIASYIRQCDGKILIRDDKSIAYTIGHQRAAILVYRALAK